VRYSQVFTSYKLDINYKLTQRYTLIFLNRVAKIHWTQEARISEEEILNEVKGVAENHEAVRGHVPILLLAKRLTVSTSTIRNALGLEDPDKGSRTLFLLVFKKLSPMKELQGNELFDAWRHCVLCKSCFVFAVAWCP
jgi:hypothetical protein